MVLDVSVWLQSRSLPARGRVGLEVHRCLRLRAERIVYNVSQACDAQPGRINVFYHEASGDRRPRLTLRAEAATYATRGGRGVRAEAATLARSLTRIT